MFIDLFGSTLKDPDQGWVNTARLRNWYREAVGEAIVLKSVLGTEPFAVMTGTGIRAAATVNGTAYAVHGAGLWEIGPSGAALLAVIPDGPEVAIAGNNGKVCVTVAGRYFVWTGTALVEPTAGPFTATGSLTFFNQRTVITEANGRRVEWSDLADPETIGGLSFATTESRDDDNLRAVAVGGSLWIFKQRSIEKWYDTGSGLAAIAGATVDLGLKAFALLVSFPGGVFFVGNDNKAYMASETGFTPVSLAGVETSIATENPLGVIYFEDEGHQFFALTFAGRPAWVFDRATAEWHERAEGDALGPWSARVGVGAYGAFLVVGDDGQVKRLTRNNQDMGDPLVRSAISVTLWRGGAMFRVSELAFEARVGGGGTIQVATSLDRAKTWGSPRQISAGAPGQFDQHLSVRGLGGGRQMTFDLRCSDVADIGVASRAMVTLA